MHRSSRVPGEDRGVDGGPQLAQVVAGPRAHLHDWREPDRTRADVLLQPREVIGRDDERDVAKRILASQAQELVPLCFCGRGHVDDDSVGVNRIEERAETREPSWRRERREPAARKRALEQVEAGGLVTENRHDINQLGWQHYRPGSKPGAALNAGQATQILARSRPPRGL